MRRKHYTVKLVFECFYNGESTKRTDRALLLSDNFTYDNALKSYKKYVAAADIIDKLNHLWG
jgi:hypothetical protein